MKSILQHIAGCNFRFAKGASKKQSGTRNGVRFENSFSFKMKPSEGTRGFLFVFLIQLLPLFISSECLPNNMKRTLHTKELNVNGV